MNVFFMFFTLLFTANSLKFCKNCKFYKPWTEWTGQTNLGKCTYFPIVYKETYNLVSGELIESSNDYEWCGKARIFESLCGDSGKYYVAKNNGTNSKR